MRKALIFAGIYLALISSAVLASQAIGVVGALPAKGANSFYVGNRAPLLASPLVKLPIGSIKPQGWLEMELGLMASGFTGHLTELSGFCKFDGSAWVDPKGVGQNGWEEMPYWLKGYGDLGYVLGDKRITTEAGKWLDGIMASQRADGYFGPQANKDSNDLWPNMLALYAMRSYYEYTSDKRVLGVMTNYFKWIASLPADKVLPDSWQKTRAGDNLDSIYWLYNHTGEKWLLDLAKLNHDHTDDWTSGIASLHGVNFAQCFREPAEYYQQTKDAKYLQASVRNLKTMIDTYGQVPGGLYGADESCRAGYTGPRQATETCSMVEMMWSDEMLSRITGDGSWLDQCEDVAFNSLPASMTADLKGLHYLTAPNQIQLDNGSKAPGVQNGGEMFSYNPYSYRCCQHNVAFGWPYFAEHLWMATADNGLAAALYSASTVSAKVGDGTVVKIAETTNYPFDETVTFALSAPTSVRFSLYLRIPAWCANPGVSVNGVASSVAPSAKGWLVLRRAWQPGDKVTLSLPMKLRIQVWEKNRNSVSVYRGPLAYSLQIGEKWTRYGGSDKWPAYNVYPTSAWNYGLIVDPKNPDAYLEVVKHDVAGIPFASTNIPIMIKAKGKQIPAWQQEPDGMVQEVQTGPFSISEPEQSITLVPMGCARLRISAFPHIVESPDGHPWTQ